ncbi:MAG: 50S ribosomal protein L29 [Anaerolineae bacterium]
MKKEEMRAANEAELSKQLDDLYQELFNLRFQKTVGQLPNTNRLEQVRHDIARIKTFLRQRELTMMRGKGGA